MSTPYKLGTLAGLRLSAELSAPISAVVLWITLSGVGIGLLNLQPVAAILGALLAVALHWLSALIHQLGQALAARRTGYPMSGIQFWLLISTALYPRDEPALPADVHIIRAVGGPIASLLFTLITAACALALYGSGIFWWVALFIFLDNLLVMTLGAILPLGFTDGSSLLYWLRRR